MIVAQKGRSFQRANPDARVIVDHGRYLLIDWPENKEWVEEPGCFAVVPYEDGALDMGLRKGTARPRRSEIADAVGAISADELRLQVERLAAIHSRHSAEAGYLEALDICETILEGAGCELERQEFPLGDTRSWNLVARRRGAAANPKLYVIGAHLDSVNHEGGDGARAPGADDNATGSVTVMQAAVALSSFAELKHDVCLVLFGGEEQGLHGSRHFVELLDGADRDRLSGVVNIDMAGSRNMQELTVLLEGAPLSQTVIDDLADMAKTYTELETQVSLSPYASDHVPFIDKGIPAVLTIEGADGAYPHEHTARDISSNLDFELHRQITMMDAAWLIEKAAFGED
ncbi:M28 family metallopeptidase [Tsuneonella flava]|uniref:M28 family metallopeptidase n=1 Tax=Tsuneonella flava TaxID=2055955 RepID=UPI0012FFE3A9|nr:M28 family metallopeptidase [Tsuneonella flava]